MSENSRPIGKTTIASSVLVTIAQLTTLSVPGVSQMAPKPPSVGQLFKKGTNIGINILVENNTVYTQLYLTIRPGFNVRDVSREVQKEVARAISDMVGMEVGKVNVHVEDIAFESNVVTDD